MRNALLHSPVSRRLVAALAVGAIALSACGGDDDTVSSPDAPADQGIDVGEPNGQDPSTVDPASGTMPSGVVLTPQERADTLLGQTEEQANNLALEFGWTVRTGRVDGESYMLTEDYMIDRMTLELDSNADGVPVVTVVIIELEGGPETFRA